jgi:superfamily II DNA or RNA helicase
MRRPWYRKCKICKRPKQAHKIGDEGHRYEPVWDGKIKLLKRDKLPSGLFWATYKEIEKERHIKFKIKRDVNVPYTKSKRHWILSDGKYDFQNECVDKVVHTICNGKGGLILNATGSGKTRIFAMIASRLDCDLLFVVDQLNLLDQARKDIAEHLGERIGKVGESHFRLGRVTVGTIQTLHAHRKDKKFLQWFKHIDVIAIDEVHTMLGKSNFDVMTIAKPLATIGLTATLGLSQKQTRLKAYSLCGPVLYEYPIKKGMKDEVLSQGIGVQLCYANHIADIAGYSANEAYDTYIVNNAERNHIITRLVSKANKLGKYTIVLVDRLKHLEDLSKRLDKKDILHKVVSGTFKGKHIKVSERIKHVSKFEKGKIRVILANKVMKKGVDIKRVDIVINATGRKSKNDAIQIFGRGVRKHKDKAGLIYIDIADIDTERRNWFYKASKSRIKALKQIGISIQKIDYTDELRMIDIFKKAEKLLHKEIKNGR